MTTFETSQGFVDVDGYRINVTARLDAANREHMKALVEKTVRLWLYVARHIKEEKRQCSPIDCPEDMVVRQHFFPLSEARVTVWGDMPSKAGFTVHSHSKAQDVLDVYWSRYDALASFQPAPANTGQSAPVASETPTKQENAANVPSGASQGHSSENGEFDGKEAKFKNKKDALEVLDVGSLFVTRVLMVKLRSQDGTEYFELYGAYGDKVAQYADFRVYRDNETAIKTGLVAKLDSLNLKPGKEATGDWVLKAKVILKQDKKQLLALSLKTQEELTNAA